MGKPRDTRYYCDGCKQFFPVRKMVVKRLETDGKKAFCPRCDSDKQTSRYKPEATMTRSSLNDAPSPAQLDYIKSLGGIPSKAKTKGEAGEMITRLKKLKGDR